MSGHGGGGKKKRRGGHAAGGGHGDARFLVTYADLLTVLMALFLVLWVLATIDLNKFKKFTQGLGDFGNPSAKVVDKIEDASPGQTVPSETVPESTAGETSATVNPATGSGTGDGTGTGSGSGSGTGAGEGSGGDLTSEQLQQVAKTLEENLQAAAVPPEAASIRVEARGLIVTIETDGVLFESGAAKLTQPGHDILAVMAPALRSIPNKVIVEGHTDKRPLARKNYDNWNLSTDRALSVLRVMAGDFGVPADRLAATGYGEFRPIDTGDTPEALAKNRRVEIVVVAKPQGATATATTAVPAPTATEAVQESAAPTTVPAAKPTTTATTHG